MDFLAELKKKSFLTVLSYKFYKISQIFRVRTSTKSSNFFQIEVNFLVLINHLIRKKKVLFCNIAHICIHLIIHFHQIIQKFSYVINFIKFQDLKLFSFFSVVRTFFRFEPKKNLKSSNFKFNKKIVQVKIILYLSLIVIIKTMKI